ncbi:hypothetical protein ID866_5150 [Astraeus odoratus]|nr:hypothetical protein ID866_5150 [Astraeus odoratus]
MDEVVPGLWIGDLPSALDVEGLKAKKIFSVLTAMRGKVTINATFNKYQINIDDSVDEDVLVHFLPSISFIQRELDRGRGVLVHCQAGVSRSATIVTAYLMYSRKLDVSTALEMLRKVRPSVEPNEGFLYQLEVFHDASYKFTRREKSIRMFYMERTVEEIMNGDGTFPPDHMFAKRPSSPSESLPNTPPTFEIRQELATREHMLDHGQLGPSTPFPPLTPAGSRRASNANDQIPPAGFLSRRPSTSLNVSISRRSSNAQSPPRRSSSSHDGRPAILSALGGRSLLESLSMSALETEDDSSDTVKAGVTRSPPLRRSSLASMDSIGRDLSDALDAVSAAEPSEVLPPADEAQDAKGSPDLDSSSHPVPEQGQASNLNTQYASPADLAAQLYSNPKLAALRRQPSLSMTSITGPSSKQAFSPPILMNPNCSGYFLEPMRWMEPFLEKGELAGKIAFAAAVKSG